MDRWAPLVFAGFGVGSGGVPAGLSKAVCGICRACRVFAGLQLGSAWAPCILQDFVCVEGFPTKHRAANRKDSWYFAVFFMC